MEQLVGWSRGATGGPVWERFLREGFVVAVADYRGGDWNTANVPSSGNNASALDDGLAVVEFVKGLPYVDRSRVSLYGVSLGGNLVSYLISKAPEIHAAVLGAPAPMWFLGVQFPAGGGRPDPSKAVPDPATADANIAPIRTPVLILVGTEDRLLPIATTLHDLLQKAGKAVRMDVYEHGYHDFVLGPQGQKRPDLQRGEILLPGEVPRGTADDPRGSGGAVVQQPLAPWLFLLVGLIAIAEAVVRWRLAHLARSGRTQAQPAG